MATNNSIDAPLPLAINKGGTAGTDAATARTNLGLGTAATQNTTAFLQPSNNLSDVSNVATARTNLGITTVGTSTTGTGVTVSGGVLTTTSAAALLPLVLNPGSITLASNTRYIITAAFSTPTLTLPTSPSVGDIVQITIGVASSPNVSNATVHSSGSQICYAGYVNNGVTSITNVTCNWSTKMEFTYLGSQDSINTWLITDVCGVPTRPGVSAYGSIALF